MRNAYKLSVENSEEKRTLGRLSHRWEDNINVDVIEIGCVVVSCIQLVHVNDCARNETSVFMKSRTLDELRRYRTVGISSPVTVQ